MPQLRRLHEPTPALGPFTQWPEVPGPCEGCHRSPPRKGALRFVTLFAPRRVAGPRELFAVALCERCYASSAMRTAAARSSARPRVARAVA